MNGSLGEALAAVHRRRCAIERRRRLANALAGWLGLLLLLTAIDAGWSLGAWATAPRPGRVYELPTAWRLAGVAMLGAGLIAAGWRWRLPSRVRRLDVVGEAQRCERALGIGDNTLVNAAQLATITAPDNSVTRELARRAVAAGGRWADRLDPRGVVDAAPARRAGRRLVVMSAAVALAMLVTPWLGGRTGLHIAVLRYLDPMGDRPPAAWTALSVEAADSPIIAGEPVRLRVIRRGHPIDSAAVTIAETDTDAASTLRVELNDAASGGVVGERRLAGLSEPVRIVARGGGGRSRRLMLRPVERPRITTVDLSVSMGERTASLRWPPVEPIRARIGSTVHVRVTSNRGDAALSHEKAVGKRIDVGVEAGRRSVAAALVTPDGLRSRQTLRLTIEGVSEAELAALAEADDDDGSSAQASGLVAADALTAARAAGEPRVAMAGEVDGGTAAVEGPNGEGEGDGGEPTAGDGEGDGGGSAGGVGRGGERPDGSPPAAPEAIGTIFDAMGATDAERQRVKREADEAPLRYRGEVAAYFLRIMREAEPPRSEDRSDG